MISQIKTTTNFDVKRIRIIHHKDQSSLQIQLENNNTAPIYDISLDHDFIKNHPVLAYSFSNPQQFMALLEEQPQNIKLTQNGNICFKFKTGTKSHEIILPTMKRLNPIERMIFNSQQVLNSRLTMLEQNIGQKQKFYERISIEQIYSKIQALQEKLNNKIDTSYQKINHHLQSIQEDINLLRSQKPKISDSAIQALNFIERQLGTFNKAKKNIQNKFNESFNLFIKHIEQINSRVNTITDKVNVEQQKLSNHQVQIKRRFDSLSADLESKWNKFETELKQNKYIVTYLAKFDGKYRTFFSNFTVVREFNTIYNIKLVNTQDIFIGIASKSIFGKTDAHKHQESIVYQSANGNILQNGVRKAGGRRIVDGQTLYVCVDTFEWKIKWRLGQNVQYTCSIHESMRIKTLYLVVMMVWKDNVIELW